MNFRFDPHRAGHAVLLAMDAGKCWESKDGLKTWVFHGHEPWPWGGGNDATFAGDTVYATTGQFGGNASILRTTDGQAWVTLAGKAHGLPPFQGGGEAKRIYALPDDPKSVWAVVRERLYHSTDGGEHWKVVHRGPGLAWIAADPKQPRRFYVSGAKNVYRTEDGAKFTPIGGPHVAGRIACDSPGRLYVAAWRGQRAGL
jgi:photosystem II stability/assembly factor-like uncharacterized protein